MKGQAFRHVDERNPRRPYHHTKGYRVVSRKRIPEDELATKPIPKGSKRYLSRQKKDAKIVQINRIYKTGYTP